jgi:hypothetical protein
MPSFTFSVDSALLKELGERLVGKPHIALAELVKNGYDADALTMVVRLEEDSLIVTDNGHGMSKQEFKDFWMRIGSTHKGREGFSRFLRRPLTGSKGVGRLAGQFLARKLTIHTVAKDNPGLELIGRVDWDEASKASDLTKAEVEYEEVSRLTTFAANSSFGTKVVLHNLNQKWEKKDIEALAREIWWLQPPFRANAPTGADRANDFTVRFETADETIAKAFEAQITAILSLYSVKLRGRLHRDSSGKGIVDLVMEREDGPVIKQSYEVPECRLNDADFEIRIYHLHRRQKYGIDVRTARDYLNEHGQVHIYDAGFHLPYYGPSQDWLGIEQDHSHRLSASRLLPDELQISHGLNYLPTGSRLLGVVHVNTGVEKRAAEKMGELQENQHLMVQITRDRLVDNAAFQNLRYAVRWALDFYAIQEAAKEFEGKREKARTEPVLDKLEEIERDLEIIRDRVDANLHARLSKNIRQAIEEIDEDNEQRIREAGLLGALATAGMSAVAFRHELNRQLVLLQKSIVNLRRVRTTDPELRKQLHDIASELEDWHRVTSSTQALFLGIGDRESRERIERWRAKSLVETVRRQVQLLSPGVVIDTGAIDPKVRFPEGTFVEWSAIIQNLLVNAANAVLDSAIPRIEVSSKVSEADRAILIQDNGKGVDLATAEELFSPFVRRLTISPARQALGMGGSGIGLTIVRMLAGNRRARVNFVQPEEGFKTAVRISWIEAT